MHSWKNTEGEATIWVIERGIHDRFQVITCTANIDGVRREAHNLFTILKGREDFEDATGEHKWKGETSSQPPTSIRIC